MAVPVAEGDRTLTDGAVDESVLLESFYGEEKHVAIFLYIYDVLEHTKSPNDEADLLRLKNKLQDHEVTVVNKRSVDLTAENYDFIRKIDFDGEGLFYNQYCDKKDGSDLIDAGDKVLLGRFAPLNAKPLE